MKTTTTLTMLLPKLCAFLFLNILFSISGFANNPFSKKSDFTIVVTDQVTETFCNACVGSVDLTVSGGQMPYVFSWSNGETTEDLVDLCLDFYEVTVTDATGCTFEEGYFVGNTTVPDVVLESQAEVDDYVANFSFCTSIPNTLRIGTTFANPSTDINDISGLSFITAVGGNIFIFQNPNLTSLTGLEQITSLGSSLNITSNDGLTDLVGLPPLTAINGTLTIDNCANLQTLEGLNQITSIGGDKVYISNTTSLTSLSALSNLQTVNGDLDIRICLDLLNLDGLDQVTFIGGDLILRDNIIMNDISSLDHAIAIGGDLEIQNTNLSNCSIIPICEMLATGANSTISNNSNGCNTADQILVNCTTNPILFTLTSTPISCFGICDGTITVTIISGGIPPFVYSWSNGVMSNFPLLPGLCADNYAVTVTDANGLTITDSIELTGPDDPNFALDEIGDDINGQNTGYFNTSILGGTGPFTYEWYLNGVLVSTDEDPTGLAAGAYTLVLNDNGCTLEYGPFIIDAITGIEDLVNQSVQVFPIPAKKYIRVQFELSFSEKVPYTLWNASGALMRSGKVSNNGLIDLNGLGNGVYFLKMEIGEKAIMNKVIIL